MSSLALLIVITFRAYVMLVAKGTLPSLIVSGVSSQVSSNKLRTFHEKTNDKDKTSEKDTRM